MSPEQEGQGHDDVRVVPPGQEDAELVSGLEAAMEQLGERRRGEVDKELRALEKVHAKHAKRVEKAAKDAGVDPEEVRADLAALKDLPVQDDEQAREAERRAAAVTKKYGGARGGVLSKAGVDADRLAEEVMASVRVPDHARALGRRGKGGGRGAVSAGADDLGWTEVSD